MDYDIRCCYKWFLQWNFKIIVEDMSKVVKFNNAYSFYMYTSHAHEFIWKYAIKRI